MNLIHNAFISIIRGWKKFLLTMLGISIGVASVIVVQGLSKYGTQSVMSELNGLGMGGIILEMKDKEGSSVLDDSIKNIVDSRYEVANVMPILTLYGKINCSGTLESVLIMGVNEDADKIISIKMSEGSFLTEENVSNQENICVIGKDTLNSKYKGTFNNGDKIAVIINGEEYVFKIIGVNEQEGGLLHNTVGEYIPPIIYMPYTTLTNLTAQENFPQLAIKFTEQISAQKAIDNVTMLLKDILPSGKLTVHNLAQSADQLDNLFTIVTNLLTGVAAISLIVACIGIMTNMLLSVRERRKEIGIRKAIGARRSDIAQEFLWESVIISFVGSLIGNLLGIFIIWCIGTVFNISIPISMNVSIITALISTITGALFGVIPAIRAGSVRPMESIRQE